MRWQRRWWSELSCRRRSTGGICDKPTWTYNLPIGGTMGRRSIYLILAFLAGMRGEGQGDSLSESVLPLFNMVGVQDYGGGTLRSLDLWQEVETGERWLAFVRHREDLYRKYVGGVRVADLDKRAGTLVLFFPRGQRDSARR